MSADPEDKKVSASFVRRLKRRDESAFNELVVTYEARVYRLVWRMLGNKEEAEDMTQEVFVQVFKCIDNFRGDSKLSTWVYRIAVNLTKNRAKYLSRRQHKKHVEIDSSPTQETLDEAQGRTSGETSRPDWEAIGKETEKIVVECLHALDADFREVLVLRDVEELSYEEVGEITNLPQGTVKSRLHRARSLLKSRVEERLGTRIS
jgi:RNA polymerase sigma-70 factor (ECF subfamily)